jgi:cysteine desulfurase/selenocysteine lyase
MNRKDFPILDDGMIYLDTAATSLKPVNVIKEINNYYLYYSANIHRGDYNIAFKTDKAYDEAREKIAKFINADTKEIVFTSGTTSSINLVANGYFRNVLKENDEVLITKAEHASNVLPWFELVKTNGIKVNYIDLNDKFEVTLDNVKNAITDKTKVIALAHITNVIGDVRPIKEICEYAHSKGILVLVDGAQSVPHIETDVIDLDVDFLAFSGHKMFGPTGIGVLYAKFNLLDKIYPVNLGGGMNESFDTPEEVKLKELPARLEGGTPNIAGAIGLGYAVDYINSIGIDNIYNHELDLRYYLVDKLNEISHIKVINPKSKSGLVTFLVDDVFPQDVSFYLNKYDICLRVGNHCAKLLKDVIGYKNTIRVSLYSYNTKEEIDKLVNLLSDKDKILREMI